jgi:hypothetical protein
MDQKHENRIGVSEVFAIDLAAFTNATGGVITNDEYTFLAVKFVHS